jgi:hypothetical protein
MRRRRAGRGKRSRRKAALKRNNEEKIWDREE